MLVFDYRRTHEVYNGGNIDRIVALILLDNRRLPRPSLDTRPPVSEPGP